MRTHRMAVIPGDGIGPEVVEVGMRVLNKVAADYGFTLETKTFPFGGEHYLATGEVLSDESLAELQQSPSGSAREPMRKNTALVLILMALLGLTGMAGAEELVFDRPETAGISGFRAKWDTPLPGELIFDAVHRSLLVRFPGAAEPIHTALAGGKVIEKVELALPFDGTEVSESVQAGYKFSHCR